MSRPRSRRRLGITVAAWAVVLPAAAVLPGALPADLRLPAGPPASVTAPDAVGALETVVAGVPGTAVAGAVPLAAPLGGELAAVPAGTAGIPGIVLEAYRSAERSMASVDGACGLTWPLLAGIGRVESGHAAGGRVDAAGTTLVPILGPVLDGGPGMAAIADTDGGRMDGNATWDRAVGPMQFIPSTWRGYAADGNGDGVSNAHNVHDAALAAGRYLCVGPHDLRTIEGASAALFRYNRSAEYVRKVLTLAAAYARGVAVLPDTSASGARASAVPPPVRAAAVEPLPPAPLPPAPPPLVEGGPATSAPPTSAPPTSAPPSSIPPTSAPPTSTPPTSAPPTSAPPTSAPPTSAPPTSAPPSTTAQGEATQDPPSPTVTTTPQTSATLSRTTTPPPPPSEEPTTGAGTDDTAGASATCQPVDPAAPPADPESLPPC